MREWLSFTGHIEPMEWGKSTYTILLMPNEIADALKDLGAKGVDLELNDHPFNMALAKSPAISGTFVCAGKAVLRAARISPGQEIEVRPRKADPNSVDVPSDVLSAIRDNALCDAWSILTPGKQRGLLHTIDMAK